jgi:uncharacterized membrane protein HdeD (DUF308 family)
MESPNPYRPPTDESFFVRPEGPNQRYWREGNRLVIMDRTKLPTICLATGEREVIERIRETVRWAHPAWFLGLPVLLVAFRVSGLLGLLLIFVIGKVVPDVALFEYSLGRRARRRRWLGLGLATLGSLAGVYVFVVAFQDKSEIGLTLGVMLGIAALVGGVLLSRSYWVVSVRDAKLRLRVKPAVFEALGLGRK